MNYTPWPSRVYSTVARLVQYLNNQCNPPYKQAKEEK